MAEDAGTEPSRRRAGYRLTAAILIPSLAALAGLWAVRVPIAGRLIDRELADSHVPARYRIQQLGPYHQRLVDVAIGAPGRPDLTADSIDLSTRIGISGVQVVGVRARGLRLHGRLADGKLSLGTLDRLLPQGGSGPFRLPAIDLEASDARLTLETPAGPVEIALTGSGRLDDGFAGELQASAARLGLAGCTAQSLRASARISITGGAPTLKGPVSADRVACGNAAAAAPTGQLTASLTPDLASWRASLPFSTGAVTAPGVRVAGLSATLDAAREGGRLGGSIMLAASGLAGPGGLAARRATLDGGFTLGDAPAFRGRVEAPHLSLPQAPLAQLRSATGALAGTPVAPLARRAAQAASIAAADIGLSAELAVDATGATVAHIDAEARSGASAHATGSGFRIGWGGRLQTADATVRIGGGGLPEIAATVLRRGPDAPVSGRATVAPYAADGARLALSPVSYTLGGAGGRLDTGVMLTGPLGDGHIDGLAMPLAVRWQAGRLAIDPDCTAVAFAGLRVSTLRLRAARVRLCPTGPALVLRDGRGWQAGGRLDPVRLEGSLGSTPIDLAAAGARVSLAGAAFNLDDVAVRLGREEAPTRLRFGRIEGNVAGSDVGGHFSGGGGRIGAVPLELSAAAGAWHLHRGALTLNGALAIADTAAPARFVPVRGEDVSLKLIDGTIRATGRLVAPGKGVPLADAVLRHDLATGTGEATLSLVPIAFTEKFQPEEITPLTYGVVADVRGTVLGDARIGWGPAGVTSTGTFHTDGLDLAAAFGPVTGLAGTIRFTDLLALESAPDQVATIASVNPGVAVENGQIVYRTLPNTRVQVSGGHWPFAGGALDLAPTLLDFSAPTERRLTFTVTGVKAGEFLQQFAFKNISATGTFDGSLPMIFDAKGGRIENGHLRVRSGGNVSYVGEISQEDLGFWGNLAFQALRSIDYRDFAVTMNGPLAGEMITELRFTGISQGAGAKSNFLIRRLQRLPFVFNIRIRAPFRGLLDSAQSFYDPSRLVERNLPELIQQQQQQTGGPPATVQPPASPLER